MSAIFKGVFRAQGLNHELQTSILHDIEEYDGELFSLKMYLNKPVLI